MKLKILTTALAAALYSAGSLYAAVELPGQQKPQKIQQPELDIEQILADSFKARASNSSMLANDGLNVQLNPQQQKFVWEDDIDGEQVYIVRLRDKPLAAASFSMQTLEAIKANDNRLFTQSRAVSSEITEYRDRLLQKQQQSLQHITATVGRVELRQQFTNAINGLSLKLTQQQAQRIAALPEVLSVQRSKIYQLHSDVGPQLIGADRVWSGQATEALPYKGEGIVIGVIDTGVNTDHPSFAATAADGYRHTNPWGPGTYVGDCAKEGFADLCNDKLIGVRSYPVITDWYTSGELGATRPAIGEDYQGHGSHVASTAAGNLLLNADLVIPDIGQSNDGLNIASGLFPQLSGVAPRANIVSYQACYPAAEEVTGCPGEALLASIDDAIADGVDVINFSIGGQDSHPWSDTVEMAFLAAREAGISVVAAAGNSGQAGGYAEYFGAIDHASPWLLNVAATTHDRDIVIETQLAGLHFANPAQGGATMPGWSSLSGGAINTQSVTGVVLHAQDYFNINGVKDQYCGSPYAPGTFDVYPDGTAIVDANGNAVDTIVVCARDNLNNANGVARTLKSDNIKAGGADGFIMYNFGSNDPIIYTASYSLPAAHISRGDWFGDASNGFYGLEDWLRNNGRSQALTITKTLVERQLDASKADWLAPFSSRGPSSSTPEALIPAVSAPGVSIYAAFADEQPFIDNAASGDFAFLSGTSMASPHVAGAIALMRQAHPDWTATEIQSALAMTADNVVQYRRLNAETGDVELASTYRAGTGRINVANAIQAGLVMDETADNFRAADPKNGGVVHKLNLPQLVNFSCKPKCQWVRTVRATKAGTWQVSADDVMNWDFDSRNQAKQNGVSVTVSPEEFSLAAGETQTIVIEAAVMDTQDIFSNSEVELHSNLLFTELSGNSPQAHWPLVFKYDMNDMPSSLLAQAHRNQGFAMLKGIPLPATATPYGRVFKPVKAEVHSVQLPKDDEQVYPWSTNMDPELPLEQLLDEATHVVMTEVPAGARRLVVESQGTLSSPLEQHHDKGNLLVYVGKDYNGNGQPDTAEEILCVSNHILANNFCNINNPEPGTYWAVFYNPFQGATNSTQYADVVETFSYAIAVVTDEVATDMRLDVPAADGREPVDVTLHWDMSDMAHGDLYYSVIDFGSSEVNAGNIGKIALKLVRGEDEVSLQVPQTGAVRGNKIPFTFSVLPNLSGADRAFTITADIPSGLMLRAEDVMASNSRIVQSITLENNKLTITGMQPDTANEAPRYNITSNLDDAFCRTPDLGNANPGGYINLEQFGINPIFSGFAPVEYDANGIAINGSDNNILSRNGLVIPVSGLFNGYYDNYHLYHNADALNVGRTNVFEIRGNGIVTLWQQPFFFPFHLGFPYQSFPYESIGMLWRARSMGSGNQDIMSVPLSTGWNNKAGISLATTGAGGWAIIEFDDARSYSFSGRDAKRVYQWQEKDDRFDFQLIVNAETRFGDNQHEMYFAYDNIDFGGQDGRGAIGLQGFKGQVSSFGPLEGYLAESYAMDDLDSKLHNGLVLCLDYVGPEMSQFEVTAWAEVGAAAGTVLNFNAISAVEGMADITMQHSIAVPSNISLPAIKDQSIDENTTLENLAIYYADEENSVNTISISGDHITAKVHSHKSGGTVSITPDKDFHGEVLVTVTVADVENPADAASTQFMLTVVSDGKDPVVVTPPPVVQPKPESKSGGSFGFLVLSLFGLLAFRRQK